MTALSADKAVSSREGAGFMDPVAAATLIYQGALVALDGDDNAIPAGLAAGGSRLVRGVAVAARADNSAGAAGAIKVQTWTGVFRLANSAGADEITRAEIGTTVHVVDDQTVAKTNGSSTRIAAGTCVDLDDAGVWVKIV